MLTNGAAKQAKPTPRERILETAYELFSRRGVRGVSVDEVVEQSGVAKATVYRQFPSKDDLVLAFLALREQRWTVEWVAAEATRRGDDPVARLLAIFDCFDEWFGQPDFEGCSFVNGLLEMGGAHPVGQACVAHLENIRSFVECLAAEGGLSDPPSFARSFHILMKGAIVSAGEGDTNAARRAKAMAESLVEEHRNPAGVTRELSHGRG